MDEEDLCYIFSLLLTIPSGFLLRKFRDARSRQWLATSLGAIIVFILAGSQAVHPVLVTLVNALMICYVSAEYCHVASFVFTFSYLLLFHRTNFFGLPLPSEPTNTIQMMLALKLVGLAFEVHDTEKLKKTIAALKNNPSSKNGTEDLEELELRYKYLSANPSLPEIFHYAFCYVGIVTGPYYKYRTYKDMLHSEETEKLSCLESALRRLKYVPLYVALFFACNFYYPLSYAKVDSFYNETSYWYRVWYLTPVFFTLRMRFYAGFALSEVACITARLGAYPTVLVPRPGQGPSNFIHMKKENEENIEYDFETVHNIDEYKADTATTVRGGMKYWNRTVQYWLAVNVHKRMPFDKSTRAAITLLTSAFWHGVYPGYYLSMLTVPFILVVEDAAHQKLQYLNPKVFSFVWWFLKMQWFAYVGMAFLLLDIGAVLRYWRSVYFIGHVLIVVLFVALKFVPSRKTKSL